MPVVHDGDMPFKGKVTPFLSIELYLYNQHQIIKLLSSRENDINLHKTV